jgi:hypothetical protein
MPGFIISPKYANIRRLVLPISVDGSFLNRGYYRIKLDSYRSNQKYTLYKSVYLIRFDLEDVPPDRLFRVLKFCFEEIFFIVANNSLTERGFNTIRLAVTANTLKNEINLKHVPLNREGAKKLLNEIQRTIQSNENLAVDKSLRIYFINTKVTKS